MFTDLFRIVAEHGLSVPPEIAGAFRALATIEGTLTQLAPGFDILIQARLFTTAYLAEQLSPAALRKSATAGSESEPGRTRQQRSPSHARPERVGKTLRSSHQCLLFRLFRVFRGYCASQAQLRDAPSPPLDLDDGGAGGRAVKVASLPFPWLRSVTAPAVRRDAPPRSNRGAGACRLPPDGRPDRPGVALGRR